MSGKARRPDPIYQLKERRATPAAPETRLWVYARRVFNKC
jgi:hypothetical protein